MDLKYFQYISKDKINMLYEQLRSQKPALSEVTSKFGLLGLELGLGVKKDKFNDEALVNRAAYVIKALEIRKEIKPLSMDYEIDIKGFYKDASSWHTGICAFMRTTGRLDTPKMPSKAYFVFKTLGDSIILLVGSQDNLIGSGEINQTINVASIHTHTFLYDHVYQHIESFLTDEAHSFPSISDEFPLNERDTYALELSMFSFLNLRELPETMIDTVFRIHAQYNLRDLFKKLGRLQIDDFFLTELNRRYKLMGFKNLFLGSPLYTALC